MGSARHYLDFDIRVNLLDKKVSINGFPFASSPTTKTQAAMQMVRVGDRRRTDQSEVDMFFLDKRAREAKITVPGASHVRGGRDGGASGCRNASGTVRHRNLDGSDGPLELYRLGSLGEPSKIDPINNGRPIKLNPDEEEART
ncbi:hypothetical protein QJS10_CPB18g01616 [Acorus calamus]|uniref:Uncharacterized protein n=1 Tax=Acorus calamus TaxID=4465 RepID=A0AAV9CJZ4_ACOCL|nr:hypothetical protein QJS10_CPB18g01616 [Acorus calamus]